MELCLQTWTQHFLLNVNAFLSSSDIEQYKVQQHHKEKSFCCSIAMLNFVIPDEIYAAVEKNSTKPLKLNSKCKSREPVIGKYNYTIMGEINSLHLQFKCSNI